MTDPTLPPPEPSATRLVDLLLSGPPGTGVNLVGPRRETDRILDRISVLADSARLRLVSVAASSATPDSLRNAVQRAFPEPSDPRILLVLAVPDAGLLSADLLRELEQAAEAAEQHGGLALLLASNKPLSPLLDEAGLSHLRRAMAESVEAPELPDEAPLRTPIAAAARPKPTPKRRSSLTLLLLALVFLVILAGGLLLFGAHGPSDAVPPPGQPAAQPAGEPARHANLLMRASPGDTLAVLYARVYAGTEPPPFALVQQMNPAIGPGARLVFPPPRQGWPVRP